MLVSAIFLFFGGERWGVGGRGDTGNNWKLDKIHSFISVIDFIWLNVK